MSTTLSVLLFAILFLGLVGVVAQLPEILSHHINQPVQRARRVRALRRKLALWSAGVFLAALSLYLWLVA